MSPSAPVLLAIDTATEQMAVALRAGAHRLCVDAEGGAAASAGLLPLVRRLLAEAGIGMAQVQGIAFGRGPGAFTGLRTACAVVQGLALAHDTPVLAVDSLLIVADDARAQVQAAGDDGAGLWWVAMDARMDEVYAAAWQLGPAAPAGTAAWQPVQPPALYSLPALAAAWQAQPPGWLAGNAGAVFGSRLPAPGARRVERTQSRAAALLRLAEAAWARGERLAADAALPLYLRDKVALTTAERSADRTAGGAAGRAAAAAGP